MINSNAENKGRVEEVTKTHAQFLDTVLENIPIMIFVKDAETLRFVRTNKATEEMTGLSHEDLIGKNDYDFFPEDEAEFFTRMDREVLEKKELVVIPEEKITSKGNCRWLHTKKIPILDSNGVARYLVGISEDITERKKQDEKLREFNKKLEEKVKERTRQLYSSEKRFRSLIENSVDVISMLNRHGRFMFNSPSAEKLTGIPLSEIKNKSPFSLLHPEDQHKAFQLFNQVIKNPGKPFFETLRVMHNEGHFIWAEGTMINLLHDKNVNAIVCNFHDITDRKTAADEKRKLENALMTERIKRQIAITRATIKGQEKERKEIGMELHDNINQVLTAVKLYLEIALTQPSAREEMIKKSSENVMLVINELRQLSKSMVPPALGATGIVDAIKEIITPAQRSLDLKVKLNICEELLNSMKSNEQLALYRIIQEQLNNIIKHSGAKNAAIEMIRENDQAVLIIRDDGKGFDTNARFNGIGLSNIQSRAEMINGKFELASAPGQGCQLMIRLPFPELQNPNCFLK